MSQQQKKEKLDEIIAFLKEHHDVDEWSGEIPPELSLPSIIKKLEKFRDEEL